MNPIYFHKVCCTTFHEIAAVSADGNLVQNRFDMDIYEIDDEWFYLELHRNTDKKNSHVIFKCDQLGGLFDCIRDIYSSFGK